MRYGWLLSEKYSCSIINLIANCKLLLLLARKITRKMKVGKLQISAEDLFLKQVLG